MASIRKRKWTTATGEARTAWRVDFIDASGNRDRRQFPSKGEADAFRVEIEGQLRTGTFRTDAAKITVADVAERFLEHCRGRMQRRERMTRGNYRFYEGHVRNYICPDRDRHKHRKQPRMVRDFKDGVANIKLAQLTPRRVADFRDRLRKAGISVPTARKILATLQLMMAHAISLDLIAVNPVSDIKVIGRRDEGSKKIKPPSKEAMRSLIKAADADFRLKLIFCSSTGVRAGELHALRWKHVSFERGELKVETRVDRYNDEDVTKTAAGMRTIPISKNLVVLLKEWKLRTKYSLASDLIFPSKRGTYFCHANMVKREFNPLFDTVAALHAEEPSEYPEVPRFNWHGLRHFAISTWIEAGLSPKAVQTFAGHSSLQVTMDRYGHLFKSEDHHKAMDEIAKQMLS
jgi:integrase